MSIALTVLVVTFALLLFAGAPVFVVLALPSALYLILEGLPLELVPQRIFTGIDIFLLLAIPLFMLAGEVMNAGRLTDRLVEFSQALVGKVRGGLAMVNVLTSMLFAGITGSAAADASAIGSMMIPMMSRQGYPKAFSVSVTAASSIVGPIIPPSIVFIMYGVLASTSIIDLFLTGVVPGILLGLSQMAVIQLVARKRGFAPGQPISAAKILSTGRRAVPAMVLPFIILTPILLRIAKTIGVEPLHLGVIMVLNLMVGTVTPPVGVCLFKDTEWYGSLYDRIKARFGAWPGE